MPTKSSTLSLVEEEAPVVESTIEPEQEESPVQEEGHPLEPAIADLAQRIQALEDRLVTTEAYIAHLANLAHSEHHMELGASEIQAIAEALKPVLHPHTRHMIFDVLKEHYGFAPPAVRGDG